MENVGQLTEEEIQHERATLVIPSTADASRVRDFTEKVKQVFAARILKTVGSWKETFITLELNSSITVPDMLSTLATIPGVEGAEEKQIRNQGATPKGILVTLASTATDDYRSDEPVAQEAGISSDMR